MYCISLPKRTVRVTTNSTPDNGFIADDAFPYNFLDNEGGVRADFQTQVQVEGADEAWLFVMGARHENLPANDSWVSPDPGLRAVIYNERCGLMAELDTGFVPALAEQAQTTPLDQIAADHSPVFDLMYRSVRFPQECAGEQP
jgi:hypothetical protein